MKVLLKFGHGLGDAVQLTRVIEVLQQYHPDWEITVAALSGKTSLFSCPTCPLGEAREDDYDVVHDLGWSECNQTYHQSPATKASLCLERVFQLPPVNVGYHVPHDQEVADFVASFTSEWGRFGLLHYEGNTAVSEKNLTHGNAAQIVAGMRTLGITPILLDWDNRSPLRDKVITPGADHQLWRGLGTGDGRTLVQLIRDASLFVGIDSGPLHCAMATPTPTIAVWTKHHPLHYADADPTTLHLLPHGDRVMIRGDRAIGSAAFDSLYRSRPYFCLTEAILGAMTDVTDLSGFPLVQYGDIWIRRDMAEQDLVIYLDLTRDDTYRLNILAPKHRSGPQVVVDVGAHIGVFTKTYHQLNPQAQIAAVEVAPANIECLQRNVGEFATVFQAACSYESGVLLNSVFVGGESTGGSMLVQEVPANLNPKQYRLAKERVSCITLEQVMAKLHAQAIDILKLDCEGSEFSILEHSPSVDKIGMMVGEFHGRARWQRLVAERFGDWEYSEVGGGDLGTFHLRNPRWKGCWIQQ